MSNKKTNNFVLLLLGLVAGGVIGFFIFNKKKECPVNEIDSEKEKKKFGLINCGFEMTDLSIFKISK